MTPTIRSLANAFRLGALAALLAACTTAGVPAGAPEELADQGACLGRNPSALAAATQGMPPYVGRDSYANVALDAGTVLYSLTPGIAPGFAVSEATLRDTGGSWQEYYALVQVTTDPGRDADGRPRKLREAVRAFHVTEPVCVARGTAMANPQFGAGGGTQYYVPPADAHKLRPGDIMPISQWRIAISAE